MNPFEKTTIIRGSLLLILVLFRLPVTAQQPREATVTKIEDRPQEKTPGTFPTKQRFGGASFAMTAGQQGNTGYSNPIGLELEFLLKPTSRHRSTPYYLGLRFNITGDAHKGTIEIPGAVNPTMEYHFSTIFLGLSQYYFFPTRSNAKPFLELDLGVRLMQNIVRTQYYFYGPILLPSGDEPVDLSGSQFSAGFRFGYFFQVMGTKGFLVKAGLDTGGNFQVCQNGSLTSSAMHEYSYEMATTNALFLTMNVGFMF